MHYRNENEVVLLQVGPDGHNHVVVEAGVPIGFGYDEREYGCVFHGIETGEEVGLSGDNQFGFLLDAVVAHVEQADGISVGVDGFYAQGPAEMEMVDPLPHLFGVETILVGDPPDGFGRVGRGHSL